jgi:hypothetical protein
VNGVIALYIAHHIAYGALTDALETGLQGAHPVISLDSHGDVESLISGSWDKDFVLH